MHLNSNGVFVGALKMDEDDDSEELFPNRLALAASCVSLPDAVVFCP